MSTPTVHAACPHDCTDTCALQVSVETGKMVALRGDLTGKLHLLLDRSAQVVLTTIVPPGPMPLHRRILWDSETNTAVDDTNNLIRGLTRRTPRVSLLDASALLAGSAAVLPKAYVDPDFFLHVNQRANEVLNRHLAQMLSTDKIQKAIHANYSDFL